MEQSKKSIPKLRRPFVAAGAAVGAGLSAWYLYRSLGGGAGADPVWTRFVNVALIMFVSIYLANLARRAVERLTEKR